MSKYKYIGDLCFSSGEYEKDGETKKRWTKAAAVFQEVETGNQTYKFEALPAADWSGWMKLFAPRKQDNRESSNFDKFVSKKEELKKDTVLEDIEDKPIDLSEIPF